MIKSVAQSPKLTVSIPAKRKSHTMPMISLKSKSGFAKYCSSKVGSLLLSFSENSDILRDRRSMATLKNIFDCKCC